MKEGLKFRGFGLVLVICLLFCFTTSVLAEVYYVDSVNGDNSNDGTSPIPPPEPPGTGPWQTLHFAIDQIVAGDVLKVAEGEYCGGDVIGCLEGFSELTIGKENVTIEGAGEDALGNKKSRITGVWTNGIEIDASSVTIKDLAVGDFSCGECTGIWITSSGTGSIIENCEIYNNDNGIYVYGSSPEIRKNRIFDNDKGIRVYDATPGTASPNISNNLIYRTGAGTMSDGIHVDASTGTASPTIYHNTIDGGTSVGIYIEDAGSGTPIIKYNIITNFGTYGIQDDSNFATIDYNDVWNNANYGDFTIPGPTDLNTPNGLDPRYVLGGYKLQSDSPCIDAIPSGPVYPVADDFDGNPRPQGSGYDMGAYEYAVSIPDTISILPGTQVADYMMVAFTVQASDPACTSVFGDEMGGAYNPANFKIGTYDAITGSYVECDSGLDIVPGRGYWMLARNGFDATVHGTPASMSDTDIALDYNETTGNGWNQIGCPNAADYLWEEVEVLKNGVPMGPISDPDTDEYIDKRLWCWENASYYPDNDYMEQREGYWVKAKMANVSLRFRQSVQMAQVSNQDVMFAGLFKKAKTWVNKWILGSQVAIADSGDSPPMPMEALSGSSADSEGSDGGCFIATVAMH